jgi:YegS/Rv2252/BmrU family lipid kinase
MKRAVLIGQSHSRHGEEHLVRAARELRARGIEIEGSHLESGHKAVRKRARSAAKSGSKLVVVCGGDGTQAAAVSVLAHTNTVLGVVPSGTGNSFASSLGIGGTFDSAIETIARGRVARVDVGVVNGRRFANFATIGLASDISERTPRGLKKVFGPIAYGLSSVMPILRQRPFRATIRWKKHRLNMATRQIIIVNGRDYGHTPVTPESSPTSGKLTFFARDRAGTVDVLSTYAAFLVNEQTSLPGLHYFQASKIKISTSRPVLIAIDGHSVCRTPATFSIERKALRVMVPG